MQVEFGIVLLLIVTHMRTIVLIIVLGMCFIPLQGQVRGMNVPAEIVQRFETEFAEAYDVDWRQERSRYVARFRMRAYSMEAFFSVAGTWLFTDIKVPFKDFPPKAKAYYQNQMSNVQISRTGYHDTNGGGYYYIEGIWAGQRKRFRFDDTGLFLGM